ncbi:glycosyltransferase [Desulfosoma caldarium]|uniref:glycosyltransferase n=1 Tax=Desulfosoma caldarium TaxID=610254 RepID=UPI001FE71F50|nr:glycosyltransferase [Desulfosoma caldarium]
MSHIFVCPWRHEPFGNVILKAWSHGAPAVSTITVGAEELMSKNQNGLLIPIAHPVALAHSMLRVLKDPLPQRDLGENGIKTVLTFSLQDRVVAQDEELDERLVQ